MSLNEMYKKYKEEFNRTAWHPHPCKLLALLLLQEKDKMPITDRKLFYKSYEDLILQKIEKVIVDFAISKEELIKSMIDYEKSISKTMKESGEDAYEKYVRMVVFRYGYNVVRWGNEKYPNANPEEVYSVLCEFLRNRLHFPYGDIDFSNFTINEAIDYLKNQRDTMKEDITISLEDIYNEYREEFIETGKRPQASELLMIKMLQEKDKYIFDTGSFLGFYFKNKELIDENIRDLMNDFSFTREDMIEYIKEKADYEIDYFYQDMLYEDAVIRHVFEECFTSMNKFLLLNKDKSVEKVYNSFVKSREEAKITTSNRARSRKKGKSVPITGFKF